MLHRASAVDPTLTDLARRISEIELPQSEGRRGLVHGDLHDRQILCRAQTARIIDLDSIDAVNLREHAELRVRQGVWDARWAREVSSIVDGLEPGASTLPSAQALRGLVRARLLAVYTLRPAQKGLAQWCRSRLDTCDARFA